MKGPGFVSLKFRNELLSLWAALFLVIAISNGVYQDWKDFQKTTSQVQHARQVMEKTEVLLSHMMDAETGQRGYLLTGKAEYLAPYERALQLVPNALEDLNELNREDELGQREMARLRPLVSQKLNELRETIELRQTQGLASALQVVLSDRGKITMDQIRARSTQITADAYSRVTQQNEAAQRHAERARIITTAGSLLLFALVAFATVTISRATSRREQLIAQLHRQKSETEQIRDLLQVTLASIGDAVISTDAEGTISFLNPVAETLTGWSQGDAMGKHLDQVFEIVNEKTRKAVESPVAKVLREGTIVGLANHTVLRQKEGPEIPIDDSGAPIRNASGKLVGVVLTFRDITKSREAAEALRESEERFRFSLNAAEVGTWDWNIVTGEVRWSENMELIHGRKPGTFGGSFEEFLKDVDPDYREPARQAIQSAIEGSGDYQVEYLQSRDDGTEGWMEAKGRVVFENGRAIRMTGVCTSITERKRSEAERERLLGEARTERANAERQREHLRSLFEQAPALINIHRGPEHICEFFHPLAKELLGGRDVTGMPAREAHPDLAEQGLFDLMDEVYRSGVPYVGRDTPATLVMPDGSTKQRFFDFIYNPWRDRDGNIAGVMSFAVDVTDQVHARKQLEANEQKLRQSAKLESLGVLAGGIAHDFNNLLVGILGNASLVFEMLPPDAAARPIIQQVVEAGEHAATLTNQMLAYSGKGRFIVQFVDISETVRQTASLLESSIPRTVQLRLQLAQGLPAIEVDVAQIQQLIMNLVINGAEACSDRPGTVTVTTAAVVVDELDVQEGTFREINPGRYVYLEVQDTGSGMDKETQAKIFDPFFTTKFTGRGLGLAAVLGIVRGHRGTIKIYSTPGVGTTFRVLLPAGAGLAQKSSAKEGDKNLDGRGKILVIDDEEIVRQTAKNSLERYGYTVLTADNGQTGIDLFRRAPDEIALIILDMTMPVMSGEDALRELQKIRFGIPIILSSGFNAVEAVRRFQGQNLAGFIQKPYTSTRLAEEVKAVLKLS